MEERAPLRPPPALQGKLCIRPPSRLKPGVCMLLCPSARSHRALEISFHLSSHSTTCAPASPAQRCAGGDKPTVYGRVSAHAPPSDATTSAPFQCLKCRHRDDKPTLPPHAALLRPDVICSQQNHTHNLKGSKVKDRRCETLQADQRF